MSNENIHIAKKKAVRVKTLYGGAEPGPILFGEVRTKMLNTPSATGELYAYNFNVGLGAYQARPVFKPINTFTSYISDLQSPTLMLRQSVRVDIEVVSGTINATVPDLGIYLWGDDLLTLFEDIAEEIVDLYTELFNVSAESLGPQPLKWKSFLKKVIRKK